MDITVIQPRFRGTTSVVWKRRGVSKKWKDATKYYCSIRRIGQSEGHLPRGPWRYVPLNTIALHLSDSCCKAEKTLLEAQCGFRSQHLIIDTILVVCRLQETDQWHFIPLRMYLVDLSKAYNYVYRTNVPQSFGVLPMLLSVFHQFHDGVQ